MCYVKNFKKQPIINEEKKENLKNKPKEKHKLPIENIFKNYEKVKKIIKPYKVMCIYEDKIIKYIMAKGSIDKEILKVLQNHKKGGIMLNTIELIKA